MVVDDHVELGVAFAAVCGPQSLLPVDGSHVVGDGGVLGGCGAGRNGLIKRCFRRHVKGEIAGLARENQYSHWSRGDLWGL